MEGMERSRSARENRMSSYKDIARRCKTCFCCAAAHGQSRHAAQHEGDAVLQISLGKGMSFCTRIRQPMTLLAAVLYLLALAGRRHAIRHGEDALAQLVGQDGEGRGRAAK